MGTASKRFSKHAPVKSRDGRQNGGRRSTAKKCGSPIGLLPDDSSDQVGLGRLRTLLIHVKESAMRREHILSRSDDGGLATHKPWKRIGEEQARRHLLNP